eukprot:TRINITY_DN50988_c0_g1_i1.p1 TRINITY_DN50988_c0_g1~~TRINITY_DN50988_c0_g1_i1.p1  ORF type:complete len:446 (-),score=94.39 TRINITY_DN50988_c0_g1_i1:114-1451(-)
MAPKGKSKAGAKAKGEPKAKAKGKAKAGAKAKAESRSCLVVDDNPVAPEAIKSPAGSGVAAARALTAGSACVENNAAAESPLDLHEVKKDTQDKAAAEGTDGVLAVARGATSVDGGNVTEEATSSPGTEGEKKTPQLTVSEKAAKLNDTPDPWNAVGVSDAFQKVRDERWEVVCANEGEASKEAAAAVASGQAVHVVAKELALSECEFLLSETAAGAVVSLDVTECSLDRADSLPAFWLRNLVLAGNPLVSFDGLHILFARLLVIDISFVDLNDVVGAWSALRLCPSLHSIVAQSSGISSFEDVEPMPQLLSLDVQENDVEEIEELALLAERFPSLEALDLRENPIVMESCYIKHVKKTLPKLQWHNSQSQKKYVPVRMDKVCFTGAINKDVNAVDGLYKNEHCSCLEGNPCFDKETCVDWENREKVAAEARKRKGLRDETGKQL